MTELFTQLHGRATLCDGTEKFEKPTRTVLDEPSGRTVVHPPRNSAVLKHELDKDEWLFAGTFRLRNVA